MRVLVADLGGVVTPYVLAVILRVRDVNALKHIPYSGLFSRGEIFANFADCSLFANIFLLKIYRCMVIYKLYINHPRKFYLQNDNALCIHENFPPRK